MTDIKLLPEQAASLHITSVILWDCGEVMVFDDQGHQMPEFQRSFEEAAPLINDCFSGYWEYGVWREHWLEKACRQPRTREQVKIAALLQTFTQMREQYESALQVAYLSDWSIDDASL